MSGLPGSPYTSMEARDPLTEESNGEVFYQTSTWNMNHSMSGHEAFSHTLSNYIGQYDENDGVNTANSESNLNSGDHNQTSERTLYLACPLYKFDRRKYQNCFRFQLKRIKDVKQHLAQKHLQPPFCENCGLQFGTDEERFIHSTLPQCPKRQYSIPSGITPMQRERLRTRATRNQSLSSQWFMLWDVLFPGRPRPGSAYMEDPMREAIMCLRELWDREGPEIIAQISWDLSGQSSSSMSVENGLNVPHCATIQGMMGALFDRFIRANPRDISTRQANTFNHGQQALDLDLEGVFGAYVEQEVGDDWALLSQEVMDPRAPGSVPIVSAAVNFNASFLVEPEETMGKGYLGDHNERDFNPLS